MDHKWISCANEDVPSLAVIAGRDSQGDTIYVARAEYSGNMFPAKFIPNKDEAYVVFDGKEVMVDNYEVLIGLRYQWVSAANGNVPAEAVKVSRASDGDFLYAGRGYYEGKLNVGQVHPSHGCLYIVHGGEEVKLSEYEVLTQPDQWIAATADSMPEYALVGGHDANGDAIYVGRVWKEGDIIPAQVIPHKSGAYVAFNCEEHKVENFEVLTGAGFTWLQCDNGYIAPGAIPAGETSDEEILYIGRTKYAGGASIGKILPSDGCLHFPYGGAEIKVESYEILVKI